MEKSQRKFGRPEHPKKTGCYCLCCLSLSMCVTSITFDGMQAKKRWGKSIKTKIALNTLDHFFLRLRKTVICVWCFPSETTISLSLVAEVTTQTISFFCTFRSIDFRYIFVNWASLHSKKSSIKTNSKISNWYCPKLICNDFCSLKIVEKLGSCQAARPRERAIYH